MSKFLRLPREKHFQPPKTSRDRQFLTSLTSESLSRAGMVQILHDLTSKSLSRAGVVQILATSWAAGPPQLPFQEADFPSQRSHNTMETQHFAQILPAKS